MLSDLFFSILKMHSILLKLKVLHYMHSVSFTTDCETAYMKQPIYTAPLQM